MKLSADPTAAVPASKTGLGVQAKIERCLITGSWARPNIVQSHRILGKTFGRQLSTGVPPQVDQILNGLDDDGRDPSSRGAALAESIGGPLHGVGTGDYLSRYDVLREYAKHNIEGYNYLMWETYQRR